MNPDEYVVIVIDSGSGSAKLGVAVLKDGELQQIQYYNEHMPMAADLELKKLVTEIRDSGKIQDVYDKDGNKLNICDLFDPNLEGVHSPYIDVEQSSLQKHQDLQLLYGNKFSEELKEKYLNTIMKYIHALKAAEPSKQIAFWLVGTAALRKADDGMHLMNALSDKLKAEGIEEINLKIISQEEEARMAFEGVASIRGEAPLGGVIDVGGGSQQAVRNNRSNPYQLPAVTQVQQVLDMLL